MNQTWDFPRHVKQAHGFVRMFSLLIILWFKTVVKYENVTKFKSKFAFITTKLIHFVTDVVS